MEHYKRKRTLENPLGHFAKRACNYNHSSGWVNDKLLIKQICDLAQAGRKAKVLDIAIGTGKIAQAFFGRVKYVAGIDICWEMARQAMGRADKILLASAERLPFKNNMFDVCVCRQGLQFMDAGVVLAEIRRVLRPGGRVVLCHLTAYGRGDRGQTFLIQKLRNPARKNFFLPQDFQRLLKNEYFTGIEFFEYVTRESVNQWISHRAIDEKQKRKIKEVYINSPPVFKKLHKIEFKEKDIFDSMKMLIVRARKKG
jgi:ubiquinone/menaquinone biosynthesis C-methylase UbiE